MAEGSSPPGATTEPSVNPAHQAIAATAAHLKQVEGQEIMSETAETTAPESDGWEWAVVEIFGHRRHAGRTREEERFGAKLLRIDVPNQGAPADHGWTTHYYGGSSIFSFTPTDEASALRINRPYASPSRYIAPPDDDGPDGSDFDMGSDD